jgi:hypothetical protein
MNGFDNPAYLTGLIISNIVAILFLIAAFRWPKITRVLFFLLFSWACWMNWKTSLENPSAYLEYAGLTWSSFYKDFINGWFSKKIQLAVGIVATCQGLIALSMLLKGWTFKAGAIGAILFLLAIAPLGVGSGFPCTIIFAAAMFLLMKKENSYLWVNKIKTAHG